MGEFELIRRYFATQTSMHTSVLLGIGDDAALLQPEAAELLVVSVDSLVEGTHFLPEIAPADLATRLLGAAVSDLAAMGARPAWFTLALTLPEANPDWLAAFAQSLSQRATELGIDLIGGDTTRGPLSLTAQVMGWVKPNQVIRRQGAQPGDLILVTGQLGDSRAGLQTLLEQAAETPEIAYLRQRFYRPEPRLAWAQHLAPWVSAGLDISDGLLADLNHLLAPGHLGAELYLEQVPVSAALCLYQPDSYQRYQWALTGGEDFELCLTLPAPLWSQQQSQWQAQGIEIQCIGQVSAQPGIRVWQGDHLFQPEQQGYDHFRRQDG